MWFILLFNVIITVDFDKELNQAAVTIQSRYRGYRSRKEVTAGTNKKGTEEECRESNPNGSLQGDVEQIIKDSQVDADLEKAAIQIQARARGYLERKKLKQKQNMTGSELSATQELHCAEDLIDDSEQAAAATKIQARARGYLTRAKLKRRNCKLDLFNGSREKELFERHKFSKNSGYTRSAVCFQD